MASGQEFRATTENDKARDFLFELSMATRFLRVGFPVSLSSISDIVVNLENGAELYVECKRLKSQKRVEKNLRKAISQLETRIQRAPSGSFAMSALDFTDLIPPKPDYILSNFDESAPRLATRLKTTLESHRQAFVAHRAATWNTGTLCQHLGCTTSLTRAQEVVRWFTPDTVPILNITKKEVSRRISYAGWLEKLAAKTSTGIL